MHIFVQLISCFWNSRMYFEKKSYCLQLASCSLHARNGLLV